MTAGVKLMIFNVRSEWQLNNIKCVYVSFTLTFGKCCNFPSRSPPWLSINSSMTLLVFINAVYSAAFRGKLHFICVTNRLFEILHKVFGLRQYFNYDCLEQRCICFALIIIYYSNAEINDNYTIILIYNYIYSLYILEGREDLLCFLNGEHV